jgi:hypothetical protein
VRCTSDASPRLAEAAGNTQASPGSCVGRPSPTVPRTALGDFIADVQASKLPAVSWVVPLTRQSEHPPLPWTVGMIATLMRIADAGFSTDRWVLGGSIPGYLKALGRQRMLTGDGLCICGHRWPREQGVPLSDTTTATPSRWGQLLASAPAAGGLVDRSQSPRRRRGKGAGRIYLSHIPHGIVINTTEP